MVQTVRHYKEEELSSIAEICAKYNLRLEPTGEKPTTVTMDDMSLVDKQVSYRMSLDTGKIYRIVNSKSPASYTLLNPFTLFVEDKSNVAFGFLSKGVKKEKSKRHYANVHDLTMQLSILTKSVENYRKNVATNKA